MLVHPLESIQQVLLMDGSSGSGGASGGGVWQEEERVVWSSAEVPYLVTHNTVSSG